MIQRTYWDNHFDQPEDRRYTQDFWSWLKPQPQDAWLLWIRTANWDNAKWIIDEMVGQANCDLAIVAYAFWLSDPAFKIRNPDSDLGGLSLKIARNVEKGLYINSDLFLDRREVCPWAFSFASALRETPNPIFKLPRILCGPFDGRQAQIPDKYDEQTESDLQELFEHMDGGLPRSEKDHINQFFTGFPAMKHFRLPKPPNTPELELAHLTDVAYLEALFGTEDKYQKAIEKQRRLVTMGANPDRKSFYFGLLLGSLSIMVLLLVFIKRVSS